jgi:hypothetical protein
MLSFKSKSLIVFGFTVLFDPIIPRSFYVPILFPSLLGFHHYVLRSSPIRGFNSRPILRDSPFLFPFPSFLGADRMATSIAWKFSARGCGLLFVHSRKINGHPLNIQKTVASRTQLICLSLNGSELIMFTKGVIDERWRKRSKDSSSKICG